MNLITDKKAKSKEITLGGAIILMVFGIIFLSKSNTDPTGIILWMGIIFLFVGIIGLIVILISYFK